MYQDPPKAVRTIASFLGLPVTDELVAKVVEHSSIAEMRQTSSFGLNHLRKGGYGGWRTMFTVAMSEFFDDVSTIRIIVYTFANTVYSIIGVSAQVPG